MGTGANLPPWQQLWELLGCGARDVPNTRVPGPEFGGRELFFGVMEAELCLQMELLARRWAQGKGRSEVMNPENFSFLRTP